MEENTPQQNPTISGDSSSAANKDTEENHPERPGVNDCVYYMRTGKCKFGMNCHFNHPANQMKIPGKEDKTSDNARQYECQFHLKGACKFGTACKFSHSSANAESSESLLCNFLGLPIREGKKECQYYMQTGSCKFGAACRFNHPDPKMEGNAPSPSASGVTGGEHLLPLLADMSLDPAKSSLSVLESKDLCEHKTVTPDDFPSTQYTHSTNCSSYKNHVISTSSASDKEHQLHDPLKGINHSNGMGIVDFHEMNMHASPFHEATIKNECFPVRPGQPDCSYYLKTGDCRFRETCKFNHPKGINHQLSHCMHAGNSNILESVSKACQSSVCSEQNQWKHDSGLLNRSMGFGNMGLAYTHPTYMPKPFVLSNQFKKDDILPEKPGQQDCQYPKVISKPTPACILNEQGLPLRPNSICFTEQQLVYMFPC
eukprot:TRINITY_DN933_c0_g1_i1.p1 TRINITY_DN933_c0_g1~~TRINITY_DN933_c0_g1_i1.p1  ORF type:complete len:493 (-),score=74.05 TRINITY_DN933_c0_g1_i1:264-1547(-)